MLHNFAKGINVNDVSEIGYTVESINKKALKTLSERFYNNMRR